MGVIGAAPHVTRTALVSALDTALVGDVVTITDTTELRWFAEGQLASEVTAWFTHGGSKGLVEERCDNYRIDGHLDRGIKRRFGETLEFKVRRSIGERFTLGPGLAGRLEVWRRWSPAECLATGGTNVLWADVHKSIVKRRFSAHGNEIVLTPDNRAMTGEGCDVEIAAVTVDDIKAWTFAFAAFGPIERRRDFLRAAMKALLADGALPARFGPFLRPSNGYPEWLALVASRRGAVSACDLRWH